MKIITLYAWLPLLLVFSSALPAQPATIYSVTDLGDLPGGDDYSSANAINEAGNVAGSSSTTTGIRAFLWTSSGGMIDLGELPGGTDESLAVGINSNNQVVGWSNVGQTDLGPVAHAFLWSSGGDMQDLGVLPTGVFRSGASAINDSGQVTGWSDSAPMGSHAFRWTSGGGMQDLGKLPGGDNVANGNSINANGHVAGVSYKSTGFNDLALHAALWRNGTVVDLGDLPGGMDLSRAGGINDSDQVVGYSYVGGGLSRYHAFLWTSTSGMIDLGDLTNGVGDSGAADINNVGQVVGTAVTPVGNRAFLWTSGTGMQDLNGLIDDQSWTLWQAAAINDAGQIVVTGMNADGILHGLLLTPIPEPSTGALALCSLTILTLNRLWPRLCARRYIVTGP